MNDTKTKLGVSAGLLGAAVYFTMLFGGYTPFLFIAAYVLLMEENEWLKKAVIKAFALAICFSLLSTIVNLIPDAISLIDRLAGIFKGSFSIPFISGIISFISSAIYFIKTIIFLLLGLQAVKMMDFPIGFVDKIVEGGVSAVEKTVKPSVTAEKAEAKTETKAEKKTENEENK